MFRRVRKWWTNRKVEALSSSTEILNPGVEIQAYYEGKRLVVIVVKFLHSSRLSDFKVIASVGSMRERYKVKSQPIDDWPEYHEVMVAPIREGHGEFIPGTEIIMADHLDKITKELNSRGQVLFTEMYL